jgi:cytochrome oxidase Cu insertion factor (SCO1/SenC/PrrC family)
MTKKVTNRNQRPWGKSRSATFAARLFVTLSVFAVALAHGNELAHLAQQQSSSPNVEADCKQHPARPPLITYAKPLQVSPPDLLLRNQHGEKVRFYTDLIKGKVVVLTFFYSTCGYLCDIQGNVLTRLQSSLGNRLGKEVFIISVTRDPATDTPVRLKAWSKRYKVKPGWTLVTGEIDEVSKLLRMFVGDGPGASEMHSSDLFIVNDKAQKWFVAPGVADPEPLLELIDSIVRIPMTGRRGPLVPATKLRHPEFTRSTDEALLVNRQPVS